MTPQTNLKERRALEITQAALIPSPDGGGYGSLETGLQRLSGHVRCPAPTRQLDVFEATISLSPVAGGGLDAGLPGQELSTAETAMLPAFESFGLNPEQLLLRGTVVQGVDWLVCLVVYTGEQTRVRLNATQAPTKAASFDRAGSRLVILTFVFLCLMVVLFAVSGFTWQQRFQVGSWFLPGAGVTVLEFLTIYLILFNGIIPISLYVTLEFVRFMQSSFIGACPGHLAIPRASAHVPPRRGSSPPPRFLPGKMSIYKWPSPWRRTRLMALGR